MLNHLGQCYCLLREKYDTILLIKIGAYNDFFFFYKEIGSKTQLYKYHSCSLVILVYQNKSLKLPLNVHSAGDLSYYMVFMPLINSQDILID